MRVKLYAADVNHGRVKRVESISGRRTTRAENLSIRPWPRPFPMKEHDEKYEWSVTEWTYTAS